MKKIVVLLMTFGLILGLVACNGETPEPEPTPIPTVEPTPDPTPIPTPEPTPEPTPIPTPDPLAPVITENTGAIKEFIQGDAAPDFTTYVTITDAVDGNVTVTLDMIDLSNVNMNAVGTFRVTYSYTNSSGLTTSYDIVFTVNENVVVFGDCDPNFPAEQVNLQLGGTPVRLGTWMRNFLDPFYFTAKQTELNDMKKTCTTRAVTEHNSGIQWWAYQNALNHTNEIIQQYLAGDFKADFYNINSHNLGALADSGAIQPITDYLHHLPEYYFDINTQMGTWKGEVYGIWTERINVNMGIYVNLDLIEEYSQANPAELWENGEWDWDALVTIASNIKANAPETIQILGMNNYDLGSYLIGSNGGKVINPETDAFVLDDPRAVNALMFAQELKERGYVWMSETNTDAGTRAKFTSGELVFYFGSDWISGDPSILKPGAAVQFQLGMVPMPVGPDIIDFETEYRVPITVGNLWVMRSGMTPEESEAMFQFFVNTVPWGDNYQQDLRYTDTMRDHMDDRTSLRAYVSASRYGYFEKTFLFGIVWANPESGVDGIGNVFAEIINDPGASVTATIAAALPSIQAQIDERLGKND
jgi:ABC-type glycerol-3-phosphate transport system substrate-binding protein